MGFGDMIKKGLQDATRVGSTTLDENRQRERDNNAAPEINRLKMEIGNIIFNSYLSGEQVNDKVLRQCERINELIGGASIGGSQSNSYTEPVNSYGSSFDQFGNNRGNGPL